MFKYKVGETYLTQAGEQVTVLGRTELKGYECLICSDGAYRYDRSDHSRDAGRCTGTDLYYSHPQNFKKETHEGFNAKGLVSFGDTMVEVTSFNEYMAILTEEMPILITKQQAMDFFNLIERD